MEKQLLFLLDYDLDFDEEEACKHFAPFMDKMPGVLPTPGQKETRAAAIQAVSRAGKARAKARSTSQSPVSTHDVPNSPPPYSVTSVARCVAEDSIGNHRNVLPISGTPASDHTSSSISSSSTRSSITDSEISTLVDGNSTSSVSISTSSSVESVMASQGGDGSPPADCENVWLTVPEACSFRPVTRLNIDSRPCGTSNPLWTIDLDVGGDANTRESASTSSSYHVRTHFRNAVEKCRAVQDENHGEFPLPEAPSAKRSPTVPTSARIVDITNQPHASYRGDVRRRLVH